jgi:hypothetical protein
MQCSYRRFSSNDELKDAISAWFANEEGDFYSGRIKSLEMKWN